MFDLERDIEAGLTFLNNRTNKYLYPSYTCPFCRTNENIDDYFPLFPIDNGKVLTVAGSGDHALQAIKDGAKKLYVFDKNIFSLYLTKLKVAACKGLNHQQFMNYFYNGDALYSSKYYEIIRDYLDDESRKFWDSMYKNGNFEENYDLFLLIEHFRFNSGNNSFRKEENYSIMKKSILNIEISYYHFDLFEIEEYISSNEMFDAIFLSNIYDWIKDIYGNKNKYENFVKKVLIKYLNYSGMIAVYVTSNGYYDRCIENRFKNIIEFNKNDKVLVYKKQN